eukprot:364210-Chlamydomonas_euryale.AAC.3
MHSNLLSRACAIMRCAAPPTLEVRSPSWCGRAPSHTRQYTSHTCDCCPSHTQQCAAPATPAVRCPSWCGRALRHGAIHCTPHTWQERVAAGRQPLPAWRTTMTQCAAPSTPATCAVSIPGRSVWLPAFNPASLAGYHDTMLRTAERLVGVLDAAAADGSRVELWGLLVGCRRGASALSGRLLSGEGNGESLAQGIWYLWYVLRYVLHRADGDIGLRVPLLDSGCGQSFVASLFN